MPRALAAGLAATTSLLVASCLLTSDLDRLNRETDEGDVAPDRDGGDSEGSVGPGGCPAGMVPVDVAGGAAFCIDAHEVSVAGYLEFLRAGPQPSADRVCAWNRSFATGKSGVGCNEYDPESAPPETPIVCVDWCDARSYCESLGRRLCGPLDETRPTNPFGEEDYRQSEWYVACSANGTRVYPYGNEFDTDACIVHEPTPRGPAFAACEGGVPGLHHMSGNVSEWDNSCDNGPVPEADGCRARGGAFWAANPPTVEPEVLRCDASQGGRRDLTFNDRGFRCCLSR